MTPPPPPPVAKQRYGCDAMPCGPSQQSGSAAVGKGRAERSSAQDQ